MISTLKDKKFYLLWGASVLGALALLPYAMAQLKIALTPGIVIVALIQAIIFYALLVFFGIRAAERVGFRIAPQREHIIVSVISGASVGIVINLLDQLVFKGHANLLLAPGQEIHLWRGVLASFYGAINEEVLLRLVAVSLIVLWLQKIAKLRKQYAIIILIIVCAVIFGVGHLPMLYKLASMPNAFDIARVMLLNGFAGIVFGILYVRYSLISAMLSHFVTDVVIHFFLMT
jgi:hypothetical protein